MMRHVRVINELVTVMLFGALAACGTVPDQPTAAPVSTAPPTTSRPTASTPAVAQTTEPETKPDLPPQTTEPRMQTPPPEPVVITQFPRPASPIKLTSGPLDPQMIGRNFEIAAPLPDPLIYFGDFELPEGSWGGGGGVGLDADGRLGDIGEFSLRLPDRLVLVGGRYLGPRVKPNGFEEKPFGRYVILDTAELPIAEVRDGTEYYTRTCSLDGVRDEHITAVAAIDVKRINAEPAVAAVRLDPKTGQFTELDASKVTCRYEGPIDHKPGPVPNP